MDDFVVSCWRIPKRANFEMLDRYAVSCGGVVIQTESGDWAISVDKFTIGPGDELCRYLSGRYGMKRRK